MARWRHRRPTGFPDLSRACQTKLLTQLHGQQHESGLGQLQPVDQRNNGADTSWLFTKREFLLGQTGRAQSNFWSFMGRPAFNRSTRLDREFGIDYFLGVFMTVLGCGIYVSGLSRIVNWESSG